MLTYSINYLFAGLVLLAFDLNTARQLDGVAITEALQIVYILECKRSTDRDEQFLEFEEADANEQHKSCFGVLRVAAPKLEQ